MADAVAKIKPEDVEKLSKAIGAFMKGVGEGLGDRCRAEFGARCCQRGGRFRLITLMPS
jgi:hypothetical protein